MRWGLSWGAQAPHHIEVMGTRYEVRTTKIAGRWTAYGTVNGVCVEATGASERAAREKWQKTVAVMTPVLDIERRVESALDDAAAAIAAARSLPSSTDSPAAAVEPAPAAPPLYPETCENPRSVDRRLRPRLGREL